VKISDLFSGIARKAASLAGSWQASTLAVAVILVWAATGPMFGFSDTWQLLCNTGTTIITFIMVFLIQSSQNKDTKAIHLKLDDLLCSIQKANEQLIDIEDATDEQIAEARAKIGANKANTPTEDPSHV
jgi:low affinity Fe/Cu permease